MKPGILLLTTLLLTAPAHEATGAVLTEAPPLPAPTPAQIPGDTTATARVVILGTGTPNADPERWGPAVAVVAGGRAYLVDAAAAARATTESPRWLPKDSTASSSPTCTRTTRWDCQT